MTKLISALLVSVSLWGMLGCSSNSEKPSLEPNPLSSYEQKVVFKKAWGKWVGEDSRDIYLKLKPAFEEGTLYVAGRDGVLMALKAENGKRLWRTRLEENISGGVGLAGSTLIIGLESGFVAAYSKETGEELWRSPVSSEVVSPAAAYAGLVVVQTIDGKLFAFDEESGKKLWDYDSVLPNLTLRGTASPIIIADFTVAGFANGKVVAIDNNRGIPRWETRVAVPKGRTELSRLVDVDGDPLIEDNVLYITSYHGVVAALDIRNGKLVWKDDASSYQGVAAGLGNIYMVTEEDDLVAIDRVSKRVAWKQAALHGRRLTAPLRFRNLVLVGDYAGYIHALTQVEGDIAGRIHMGRDVIPPPRHGRDFVENHRKVRDIDEVAVVSTPVVADDLIITYSSTGYLAALKLKERKGWGQLLIDSIKNPIDTIKKPLESLRSSSSESE